MQATDGNRRAINEMSCLKRHQSLAPDLDILVPKVHESQPHGLLEIEMMARTTGKHVDSLDIKPKGCTRARVYE
jgi:hypothetical protein